MKISTEPPFVLSIVRNTMSKDHLELTVGIPDEDHGEYGIVLDRTQSRMVRDYLNRFLKDDTTDTTVEALLAQLAAQETELIRFRRHEAEYGESRKLINEACDLLRKHPTEEPTNG